MSHRHRTHSGRLLKRLRRPLRDIGRAITTSRLVPTMKLAHSLYERYPDAITAPRRTPVVESVPLDQVVGTASRPPQHDVAFRPIPARRTQDWKISSTRLEGALDRLESVPPVELMAVGGEYFVVDGHKRVAVAKAADGVEIDAVVTRLWPRGAPSPKQ